MTGLEVCRKSFRFQIGVSISKDGDLMMHRGRCQKILEDKNFSCFWKKNKLEKERERVMRTSLMLVDASFIFGQFPEFGWSPNRPLNFV